MRKLIKNENGQVKKEPPREEAEERKLRIVVFRCKCNETGKILKPLPEEIRPPFPKWVDEVEFCLRGYTFGTLGLIFKDEETGLRRFNLDN